MPFYCQPAAQWNKNVEILSNKYTQYLQVHIIHFFAGITIACTVVKKKYRQFAGHRTTVGSRDKRPLAIFHLRHLFCQPLSHRRLEIRFGPIRHRDSFESQFVMAKELSNSIIIIVCADVN